MPTPERVVEVLAEIISEATRRADAIVDALVHDDDDNRLDELLSEPGGIGYRPMGPTELSWIASRLVEHVAGNLAEMAQTAARLSRGTRARALADARHGQPGGNRDRKQRAREYYGAHRAEFKNKDVAAEYISKHVCRGVATSTVRRWLRGA